MCKEISYAKIEQSGTQICRCTAALEISGTIFSERRSPKDISLLLKSHRNETLQSE